MALPTVLGEGVTAARFAALVKAAETPAAYTSRPQATDRYELAYGVERQLTTARVHRPRTRDLAAVPTAYHDNVADSVRYVSAETPFFGSALTAFWSSPMKAPHEHIEYFTPGAWDLTSSGHRSGADTLTAHTLGLKAGTNDPLVWNKAVVGPTLPWPACRPRRLFAAMGVAGERRHRRQPTHARRQRRPR